MKLRRIMGSMVMVLALVAGLVGVKGPDAEAKTKSYTLLTGESGYVSIWGSPVSSIKNSKKSVVTVKKSGSYKVKVKAKKKGSSKVVIRLRSGKAITYKFTVKKPKFDYVITRGANNYIIFKIKNKTGTYISNVKFKYHMKDAAGNELVADDISVSDLTSGGTAYYSLYSSRTDIATVTLGKGKCSHYANYKYTNANSKVSVKKKSSDGKNVEFTIKNKGKNTVDGVIDVVFYDAAGNVLVTYPMSVFLTSKSATTRTALGPTGGYDHYKLVKRITTSKIVS